MRFRWSTRLPAFDYIGCYRYSVTICTDRRARFFTATERVEPVKQQMVRTAHDFDFAVIAYCFMPDHLHLLIEGTSDASDFRAFMHAFKQRSSFSWKRDRATALWERSYFEHVLRDEEDTTRSARYIVGNPVRAGLVQNAADYSYSGSEILRLGDLLDSVRKT